MLDAAPPPEPAPGKPFLTAEWRYLAMLNYPVDREILEPLVPPGTALDTYQGKAYVSMVGFLFLKTKVLGLAIPFHQDFEEVNLRFYVRRFSGEEWRRGVVFIKEIVPKPVIATVARVFYNENYVSLPMRHALAIGDGNNPVVATYGWQFEEQWNALRVKTTGEPKRPAPGSLAEFIAEHYWGYALQRDGGCVEYRVEHPPWRVWQAGESSFDCAVAQVYGAQFAGFLSGPPSSAFLAEGSPVTVYRGVRI